MKTILRYILLYFFTQLFLATFSIAQTRNSSSVPIRIKVVKSLSVNISEMKGNINLLNKNESIDQSGNKLKRDILVEYVNNSKQIIENSFSRNSKEIYKIPQLEILYDNSTKLSRLNGGEQLVIKNLQQNQKLNLFYTKSNEPQIISDNIAITIVY